MNDILVSIIILTYNQEKTIAQAIESVLCQDTKLPYEIIIGDDCSTDGTRDICVNYHEKFPEIVKLHFSEENLGVAANFVTCVNKAVGKYVATCDGDDYWHNLHKMQLEFDFLEANPDYGLVYSDYDKLNTNSGRKIKNYMSYMKLKIYEGDGLITKFFEGLVPALSLTIMFRRDLYEKYIPAEDYIKYKFTLEDWPTWLILSKYSKIGYIHQSTGTYRYGHESLSNFRSVEYATARMSQEKIMYKYICDMFPDDLNYCEQNFDNYVQGIMLEIAYKRNDYKLAKKFSSILLENNVSTIKIRSAQNIISFYAFALLRKPHSRRI